MKAVAGRVTIRKDKAGHIHDVSEVEAELSPDRDERIWVGGRAHAALSVATSCRVRVSHLR